MKIKSFLVSLFLQSISLKFLSGLNTGNSSPDLGGKLRKEP